MPPVGVGVVSLYPRGDAGGLLPVGERVRDVAIGSRCELAGFDLTPVVYLAGVVVFLEVGVLALRIDTIVNGVQYLV